MGSHGPPPSDPGRKIETKTEREDGSSQQNRAGMNIAQIEFECYSNVVIAMHSILKALCGVY